MTNDARLPPDIAEAGRVLADPAAVADESRFHAAATTLRRSPGLHWVDQGSYPGFWAVARHAGISDIERRPDEFVNTDWSVLMPTQIEDVAKSRGALLHSLINMDGEEHRNHRGLAVDWFSNRSVKALEPHIRQLATRALDGMAATTPTCDFAADVAKLYPLQVIMSILGIDEDDQPRMLQLTQELFGVDDDEFRRGPTSDPAPIIRDFAAYFDHLTQERRSCPTHDFASIIANGTIDGCPLGPRETLSYYVITATAGHDTTSAAIAGGVRVLAEQPQLLEQLHADTGLVPGFVDEVIRWVTPVKHFLRTSVNDCVIDGQRVEAGDRLMMCYWSANRDETVFTDPFRFDPRRQPNKHLGFGVGPHFCLGAGLARLEMRIFFEQLVDRFEQLSIDGPIENVRAVFVSGLKRLPIRYSRRAHQ